MEINNPGDVSYAWIELASKAGNSYRERANFDCRFREWAEAAADESRIKN